ncbi:hypothetical protein J1786_21395 [Rahnella sp. L72c]|uniref:Glycine-rich domain-containing protein n=1 Tax=Rahnella perminowiae TaxID=2816244 RepID=A0ABS6L6E8_9GAMM|nr:hypothetical protein [Rahnella perminowiae]MBU9837359.1 hypothetical protein [Rahnella perminowiae]
MALTLLASNNASTVLAAGISATATALTVNTGTGALFPSPVSGTSYFKLTLLDAATGTITEIMHVTAVSGDTFTVLREQEGTTARIWSANDIAANMLTAGSLLSMLQINNNLSEIAAAGSAAQNAALKNLGSSDGTLNGRMLSAPKSFLSSALYTPTPGTTKVRVKVWGAGGGGAGVLGSSATGGAAGGAGAYAESWISIPAGTTIPVTVGSGGTAGGANSSTAGGSGGASSFGTYLTCPGGIGGAPSGGGAGATAPSSTILSSNGQSGQGVYGGVLFGGTGGAAFSSYGGLSHSSSSGDAGGFPGGGGAGSTAGQSSYGAGKGANGCIIIEEYA